MEGREFGRGLGGAGISSSSIIYRFGGTLKARYISALMEIKRQVQVFVGSIVNVLGDKGYKSRQCGGHYRIKNPPELYINYYCWDCVKFPVGKAK